MTSSAQSHKTRKSSYYSQWFHLYLLTNNDKRRHRIIISFYHFLQFTYVSEENSKCKFKSRFCDSVLADLSNEERRQIALTTRLDFSRTFQSLAQNLNSWNTFSKVLISVVSEFCADKRLYGWYLGWWLIIYWFVTVIIWSTKKAWTDQVLTCENNQYQCFWVDRDTSREAESSSGYNRGIRQSYLSVKSMVGRINMIVN